MLNIHIGTPKTGTTAIQGFLQANGELLNISGVNYVSAGRSNIAHNSMLAAFKKGNGQKVCDAIAAEVSLKPKITHILSSEMFFRDSVAQAFADHFPDELIRKTRIICYIRRQDKYLEALYKQLVKNGRIPADPMGFLQKRRDQLAYSGTIDAFAKVFGRENTIVRPFERSQLPKGDVVNDFAQIIGLKNMRRFKRNAETTNKTLSVDVSEILGAVSRNTPFNTRQIIREIIHTEPEGAIRSNDVFDRATRRSLVTQHAKDNEKIRVAYCPDVKELFDWGDLDDSVPDPLPDSNARLTLNKQATEAVLQAIGRLETTKASV